MNRRTFLGLTAGAGAMAVGPRAWGANDRIVVAVMGTSRSNSGRNPGRGASLSEGLSFLREILTRPVRGKDGVALDEGIVATEAQNLVRSLRAIRDDKGRYAIRRCLEELARERPIAVCFDDVHWAAPTLLDLIEYLAGWMRDAPILLLVLARSDLLDLRPTWASPRPNSA